MVLSADELLILEYLKSWDGEFVSITEISRRAGGRKKFQETPNWAKVMMNRLLEAGLIQVNERGHYRSRVADKKLRKQEAAKLSELEDTRIIQIVKKAAQVIEEDYFPESDVEEDHKEEPSQVETGAHLVDEDYFPGPAEPLPEAKSKSAAVNSAIQMSHLIDEDYFPGPEESLPEVKKK